jgi:hypothetical protein
LNLEATDFTVQDPNISLQYPCIARVFPHILILAAAFSLFLPASSAMIIDSSNSNARLEFNMVNTNRCIHQMVGAGAAGAYHISDPPHEFDAFRLFRQGGNARVVDGKEKQAVGDSKW